MREVIENYDVDGFELQLNCEPVAAGLKLSAHCVCVCVCMFCVCVRQ